MTSDRVTVSAYSGLVNRLLFDTVNNLRHTPRRLCRAANVVINRNEKTTASQLNHAIYLVRRQHNQLANDIRFVDSALFEQMCILLDIPADKAYSILQRKYAAKCKAALELAVKAERDYVKSIENK